MIDITKEEFWENKDEEVYELENKSNKVKEFILKHKIITILLINLAVLITVNTVLIYKFLRILTNM